MGMSRRVGIVLLTLVVGAGLLGVGLFAFSRSPTPLPVTPTLTPTVPPMTAAHVARVNQQLLTQAELSTAYAIDHALSSLLEQPTPVAEDVLERQVNMALVTQAAEDAGFMTEPLSATQALSSFVDEQPFSVRTLTATLTHYGIPTEVFVAYYQQLRLVDRFTQQAAQARGQDVAAYIADLQEESEVALFADNLPAFTPPPPIDMPSPTPSPSPTATPLPVKRGTSQGDYAPDFDLPTLSGEPARISWAEVRGTPTVLSFWVTWCSHCRAQTPRLIAAYKQHAESGIQFVGVNIKEEESKVRAYVMKQEVPYSMLLDVDGTVAARYEVQGLPTTYFLDVEGRVVARHVGELKVDDLDRYLAALRSSVP
jgi:peroxiredoxin